jgi:hypothetical protein
VAPWSRRSRSGVRRGRPVGAVSQGRRANGDIWTGATFLVQPRWVLAGGATCRTRSLLSDGSAARTVRLDHGQSELVARMNWDRVGRENRLANAWDYSAQRDDEERTLFGEPDRPSKPQKAGRRGSSPSRGATSRSQGAKESGAAVQAKRTAQPKPATRARHSGKPSLLSKAERDRRTAEVWGVTVSELKAIRRRVAEVNTALSAEAKRRRISTKELRRQIESGAVPSPVPPLSVPQHESAGTRAKTQGGAKRRPTVRSTTGRPRVANARAPSAHESRRRREKSDGPAATSRMPRRVRAGEREANGDGERGDREQP